MKHIKKQVMGTVFSAALLVSAAAPAALADTDTNTNESATLTDMYLQNVHKKFMSGNDDGTFGTNDSLLRCDAAQIIFNLLNDGSEEFYGNEPTFTDVQDDSQYYYNAIGYLQDQGIISGYDNEDDTFSFKPNENITRSELLAMLDMYIQNGADGVCEFSDVTEGDDWAYNFIKNAAASGWVMGDGGAGGTFRPDAEITRAEATAIFVQALERNDGSVPAEDDENAASFPDVEEGEWYYNLVMEATNEHDAYDNIYSSVLTRYQRAATTEYKVYDKNTVVSSLVERANSDVYYTYADIDGDGKSELIISVDVDGEMLIVDIYAYELLATAFEDGEGLFTGYNVIKYDGEITLDTIEAIEDGEKNQTTFYTLNEDGTFDTVDAVWTVTVTVADPDDETITTITTTYHTYERDTEGNIIYEGEGDEATPVTTELTEDEYNAILADHPATLGEQEWVTITDLSTPEITVPDEGTGDEGTGDEGAGDEGTGDEGTGDEGTGDEGTGNEGTGE